MSRAGVRECAIAGAELTDYIKAGKLQSLNDQFAQWGL